MKNQPKGSMCNICEYKYNDCSSLEFEFMNIIKKPNIVKCTFFKKETK